MKASFQFIDTSVGLKHLLKSVENMTDIAVDLEADSMYHFQEKVCLIQIATRNESFVIDPIQIKDLSTLKPLFSNPKIRKIFHGADYDVRSLYRDFSIEINHLFDTQVACMFLGYKETGLDAVLQQKFNIRLDKKYQKKDWSLRPLSDKMIAYAVADVSHLIPLSEILEKELDKKGRLSWVYEESELLSKVRPASNDNEPLYLKFRGAGRLDRRSLGLLEALLQFRMRAAQKKDKPLFKILSNKALLKVALEKPTTLSSLKKAEAFSPKQIEMYGKEVVAIVRKSLKIPKNKLPKYPKKRAPRVEASAAARVKILRSWRDSKTQALAVDPGTLFSNALISAIAIRNPQNIETLENIEEIKTWQSQEFGKEITALLRNLK